VSFKFTACIFAGCSVIRAFIQLWLELFPPLVNIIRDCCKKSHYEINAFLLNMLAIIIGTLLLNTFCQDNSSEISSIMPDEFGEHMTKEIRDLHTESLQIHEFMLVPLLIFYRVQVRELGLSWQKRHLMFVLNSCPDGRSNHNPL